MTIHDQFGLWMLLAGGALSLIGYFEQDGSLFSIGAITFGLTLGFIWFG